MNYSWENYTTLVAEDDPLNFKYIELLLNRRTGINIVWAKNGLDAVEICRTNSKIDIVLLDLQLPGLDGIKTLQEVRKFKPYLPIVIQTANTWNNEEEQCFASGCDGFFNKPLNIDKLLKSMDIYIRNYSKRKQAEVNE